MSAIAILGPVQETIQCHLAGCCRPRMGRRASVQYSSLRSGRLRSLTIDSTFPGQNTARFPIWTSCMSEILIEACIARDLTGRITDTAHAARLVLWSASGILVCRLLDMRMSNLGGSARSAAPCAMNSTARRPRSPSSDADARRATVRRLGVAYRPVERHPGPITCSPSPAYGDEVPPPRSISMTSNGIPCSLRVRAEGRDQQDQDRRRLTLDTVTSPNKTSQAVLAFANAPIVPTVSWVQGSTVRISGARSRRASRRCITDRNLADALHGSLQVHCSRSPSLEGGHWACRRRK